MQNRTKYLPLLAILSILILLISACGEATQSEPNLLEQGGEVDENGKPTLGNTGWVEPAGKLDSTSGRRGLPVSVDESSTAVWEVTNAWTDTDTPAARKAGIAWPENSGLDWEEKYRAWISSFERIDSIGYGETFTLTTPWGKTLPAPALECAEVLIFLRVTFASWYGLPYFMEATDGGKRLYFGHFGLRTADGRWGNMPKFKTRYADYSSQAQAYRDGEIEWPSDPKLAGLSIPGSFDDAQPMLESADGETKHAGAYFDEIYLNKRVGYFMRLQLTYFGSINLADSVNTFNLAPEAVQAGDMLLERWQRRGIGHALAVMRTRDLGTQEVAGQEMKQLEAELASGSMPRRQPKWDDAPASKRYFTMDETGGPGYETFGGGLKRWRQATNIDGRWTNVVPPNDRASFINSNNHSELSERPARFEELLSELDTEAKMDVVLEVINSKRAHLQSYPSSCAARTGREDAFRDLYDLGAEMNITPEEIDRRYRRLEDYVFAELVYSASKTCCWNASTAAMYDLIMEYNLNHMEDPESGTCQDVTVFMARDEGGDGYERFRAYAESVGQGDAWVEWSAGESCPQADVLEDRENQHLWEPFCSVYDDIHDRL
ncbi:hypothetical protein [Bradymonas sediminis]|uniref:Uncharacterized protein n=1 Tax=Bradymonas sediminis TaxID=1548548 RepID=A0A2Z4FI05_9DELT|nr:hypothetical protein [Bradymonas sediminis]AWV88641.1 hypothetical protein DN745_04530 [Bradymonas sediminis]TDP63675.1 hypothetical protein DFR33_110133 [Bradymonas sediminis]